MGQKEADRPPSSVNGAKRKLLSEMDPSFSARIENFLGHKDDKKDQMCIPSWKILQTLTKWAKRKLDHLLLHLEAGSSPPSSGKWAAKRKLMMRVGPPSFFQSDGKLLGQEVGDPAKKINVHPSVDSSTLDPWGKKKAKDDQEDQCVIRVFDSTNTNQCGKKEADHLLLQSEAGSSPPSSGKWGLRKRKLMMESGTPRSQSGWKTSLDKKDDKEDQCASRVEDSSNTNQCAVDEDLRFILKVGSSRVEDSSNTNQWGKKEAGSSPSSSGKWAASLDNATTLGEAILENQDIPTQESWFWIGLFSILGFGILFNVLFTFALMYFDPLGKPQAIISKEAASGMETQQEGDKEKQLVRNQSNSDDANDRKKGMILPFTPLAMSFDSVNYFVDMPQEMREQGVTKNRLQLLREVTATFRPGVLTALMGISGAGKTTLMDVLAGRKTSGYVEGDIRISGFLKKQETFARISGYCEQTDIHSPNITVHESLIYSAFLCLPKEVTDEEKMIFVREVMELVELDNLKDGIAGLPEVSGLSTEQRKRLTIAVELAANPSIIFIDEPTLGLDARAAAIVMRAVRNTVDTGRTVVCTIHQPCIDIFESFDELLRMKRGGQEIHGVPKILEQYNPATWMLEVTSSAAESRLGIDFAEHFKSSAL
ncbi:ABC transporter G family member 35-like protein [Tanacetum coccineum]